jgi:hypothetical protein
MAYRRTAIYPSPRAVLATSVIGLIFLPVARFSRCLLSNCYRCSLLKADHPEPLPDKVPVSPDLSPPSCLSDRWGKLPRVSGASTFPSLTLCAVSFFVLEGADTSTISIPSFSATRCEYRLLASQSPARKSTWRSSWTPTCFLEVPAVPGLVHLCRCCTLAAPDALSRASVIC